MKMYNRENFGFNNFNKKKILVVFSIYIFFFAFFLSVGFAAFQETMIMEDISAEVRIAMDVRVSGFNVISMEGNAIASNTDYNYNRIYGNIILPSVDSYVVYEMAITNLGNAKAGISEMNNANPNLKFTLLDYNIGDALYADGSYTLGITQKILIKIENADGITLNNENQTFNIELAFGHFHSITYHGVPGEENHPREIMDGRDLVINSDLTSITRLKVTQDTVFLIYGEHYFYDVSTQQLTIKNVTGDLLLSYRDTAYLINLSSLSEYYKEPKYINDIVQIEFVNYVDISNAVVTYDLSESKDNSIVGWLNDNGDSTYNLYIGSVYDIYTKNFERAFAYMEGLHTIKFDNLNTSESRSFNYTFFQTKITNLDLSTFNTSSATEMINMFSGMTNLKTLDVSNFNTSKVVNMSSMFTNLVSLTELDISTFNTSNVTTMAYMFSGMVNLKTLNLGENFKTYKVKNMRNMFAGLQSLTSLDVTMFDTTNLTNAQYMFAQCNSLKTLDLSSLEMSKVTNMNYMFYDMLRLESLDISNFDTSSVETMESMFRSCGSLKTLDVSSFNTSNVTNMTSMFSSMYALENLDLSSFDTSKVSNMESFLAYCTSLQELNFRNSTFTSVTNSMNMFQAISNTIKVIVKDEVAQSFIQNKLGEGRGIIIIYTPPTDEGTTPDGETIT